jgi:hypothetical protein
MLVRVLETLGQAVVDMRGTDAADPRLVLEIALVRLTRRDAGPPLQMVIERLEKLESAAAEQRDAGGGAAPPATSSEPVPRTPGATVGAVRKRAPKPAPKAAAQPDADEAAAAPAAGSAEPEPAGEQDAPRSTASIDVDDVILAWAAVLPELPVATRSAVQEAQPLSIDGDVVIFGVSPRLIEAAKPRFRREADTIRGALSHRLGRNLRFNLVAHEGFTGAATTTAPHDTSTPAAASEPDDVLEGEPVEMEPGVESKANPTAFLTESLGATVVEERQHD